MQQNKIKNILQTLVSTPSYVPFEIGPYTFLREFLQKRGFRVSNQMITANRQNLLAEIGRGGTSVLIYMHIDTVPPPAGKEKNLLKLKSLKDRYYGLGCFDMKGGIAVILSLLDQISLTKHKLKLAFCVDEEGISEGVFKLARSQYIEDVEVAFSPEASIVSPAWDLPIVLTIGGKGRCVMRVTIGGLVGHGSDLDFKKNSAFLASLLITRLSTWRPRSSGSLGQGTFFVRSLYAESRGLSLPEETAFDVDYQLTSGETSENVRLRLDNFIYNLFKHDKHFNLPKLYYKVNLVARKTPYIGPYFISKKSKYVRQVSSLFVKRYGFVDYDYAKSVADQNVLARQGIPIITLGPIGGGAHEPGEWVSIKSLNELASIYLELLKNY